MHRYRSHNCGELNKKATGSTVKISGWLHKKRDHGNLLFLDIRDNYGITQCVIDQSNKLFKQLEKTSLETVLLIEGDVVERSKDTINKDLPTGEIEIHITKYENLGECSGLPMPVFSDQEYAEEIRLKYRYIDLRRKKIHENILLRSKIISFIRENLKSMGFNEFQTPILTSSSPEGARDFLVPSRLNFGKFYALPQAPQQFKQLIMVAGFDKYFQIAPCFRDEDARADRSPGEFYQLDLEMSFVTQEDVFKVIEKLFFNLFQKFGQSKQVLPNFTKISYEDSMINYGTDKPDLRNPLIIKDITKVMELDDVKFEIFKKLVSKGSIVRVIKTPKTINKPRSFFDNIDKWAKDQGASGLAYFSFEKSNNKIIGKGTIGKLFGDKSMEQICKIVNAEDGDSLFLACGKKKEVETILSLARNKIGEELNLIDGNKFQFCWVVDYPLFEIEEKTKKIVFSHNPFSMPQGNLEELNFSKPLDIKAFQYDLVCNGVELSSGAIRNHKPDLMYKLFKIAGYSKEDVDNKFSGMITAFKHGAPPHGGIAPGIDRIVMLLANEKNIREVIMFPLNQNAQDLMMNAPSEIDSELLKDLGLKVSDKKN